MNGTTEHPPASRPLCVDVDGTLIRTDLLVESLAIFCRQRPVMGPLLAAWWLLHGRAHLKHELAKRVTIDFGILPRNRELVSFLEEERAKGRQIVLASASSEILVRQLNESSPVADEVIGSTAHINLKGSVKAAELQRRYGLRGFDYVGDSTADLKVWSVAEQAYVVSSNRAFVDRARAVARVERVFCPRKSPLGSWSRALRVHQWAKNLLVFIPVMLAHHFHYGWPLLASVIAFFAFSATASGVYVLNDVLDLDSDRRHPKKRFRPLAHGDLPLTRAFVAIPACFFVGGVLGSAVSWAFVGVLGVYFVVTCLYSFALKQIAVVDILVLAGLYTLRIFGGGVASGVPVSQWLLGFSMFIFLSLACVKRFSELHGLRQRGEATSRGRGYTVDDMEQVAIFGAASGYIAALVLALYVNSRDVQRLYSHSSAIFFACPLLVYWISRVWLLARRGVVHEDPLVFAFRDKVTYVVVFLTGLVFLLAK